MNNNKHKIIAQYGTVLIGISGLIIAFTQSHNARKMNEITTIMLENEIEISKAQLTSVLLPSLIGKTELEREIALFVLNSRAPNLVPDLLRIISEKDTSSEIGKFATKENTEANFIQSLSDAIIFYQLKRYRSANGYFLKSLDFIDESMLDTSRLSVARSRVEADSDSLAAVFFIEVFQEKFPIMFQEFK